MGLACGASCVRCATMARWHADACGIFVRYDGKCSHTYDAMRRWKTWMREVVRRRADMQYNFTSAMDRWLLASDLLGKIQSTCAWQTDACKAQRPSDVLPIWICMKTSTTERVGHSLNVAHVLGAKWLGTIPWLLRIFSLGIVRQRCRLHFLSFGGECTGVAKWSSTFFPG